MSTRRTTMKFLLPISVFGIKSESLSGRKVVPLYISPQSFDFAERKLIKETFTKGGYMVEYWGEELPTISCNGATGSGGIEAIDILNSVYRNEQIQMERLLVNRSREIADDASAILQNTSTSTVQGGIVTVFDELFGAGVSEIINGAESVIDRITSIFDKPYEQNLNPVTLIPSLAAFAVSMDLYYQGCKYRGYFTDFRYSETAESPGLFDYGFSFKVLRKVGKRKNFMPWHRNPYNSSGEPTEASVPLEGQRLDELTFPSNFETLNSFSRPLSTFTNSEGDGPEDINNVGVSRFKKVNS